MKACVGSLLVLCLAAAARAADVTVGPAVARPWLGFGYNQYPQCRSADGHDGPWTDAAWTMTTARMAAIRPALVRVNAYRSWFNADATGAMLPVGTYRWDAPALRAFVRVLRWYDDHRVPVMTGLWSLDAHGGGGAAAFVTSADASRLQVDLMRHLRDDEHLRCVRWYTPINEPGGSGVTPADWATLLRHTHDAFATAGLPTGGLLGPDTWDAWTVYAAEHCRADLAGYDHHKYLNDPPAWLAAGGLETYLTHWLTLVDRADSDRRKPVLLTECAADDPTDVDYPRTTPPFLTTYPAEVASLDYGVQVLRAGESGALAWALDGFDRGKDAGFWNLSGAHGGTRLRPWYYSWSLLCRLFPAGGEVHPLVGCRGAAVRSATGWAVVIVNRESTPLDVRLALPVPAGTRFDRFTVSSAEAGDGSALSLPSSPTVAGADGVHLAVPADGGILLATAP